MRVIEKNHFMQQGKVATLEVTGSAIGGTHHRAGRKNNVETSVNIQPSVLSIHTPTTRNVLTFNDS